MSTGYLLSPYETYPEQPRLFGAPAEEPKTLQQKLNEAKKIKANLQAKINAKKQDPQPLNNKQGGKRKNRTQKRKGRKTMTRRRR